MASPHNSSNPYPDLQPPPPPYYSASASQPAQEQAHTYYPGAGVASVDYHLPNYRAPQALISDSTIKALFIIASLLMTVAVVLLLKSKVKIPGSEL
mmetsp:Transcript_15543/g.28193  ORF Transcript_15543/g.28193 Transcript_15543/m.28193 type:complete len:96 (+) Transcript_15543:389-676(+)